MKKRILVVITIVFIIPALLTACVSSGKYTDMVSQRDTAQTQLESTTAQLIQTQADLQSSRADLTTANATINDLQSNLDTANSQLSSLKSQLQALQSSMSDMAGKDAQLQQSMAKAKALADLLALFTPYLEGPVSPSQEESIGIQFIMGIGTSGDPELQALFEAYVDSNYSAQSVDNLMAYIFKTIPDLLDTSGGGGAST